MAISWTLVEDTAWHSTDARRKKYAFERDRRLRQDGIAQHVEIAGRFAEFARDPWSDPDFTRDPLSDDVDVAIVGAGFGGLAAAVALRRKGIDDLLIIERADGVGGTWRQNVHPGAACVIQSHLYSFLFATNRAWTRTYACQPEILAYLEKVADDFDLRRHLMLGSDVRRLVLNTEAVHWEVELADDLTIVADVVVSAVGLFGAARYRDIAGLTEFDGNLMHTSQWDAGVDLTRKRIAVIGTGASGVQVVPQLATTATQLTVFQRTPPWMVPKEDRPYTVDEPARFRRYPWAPLRERWRLWKLQHDNTALTPDHPRLAAVQELSEKFLRRHVENEALRDALTPRYPFRCKRVLLGERYYTALRHQHFNLVTDPIERITDTSVITSGGVVDVDGIVLATGVETSSYLSGLDVVGVGGQSLHDRWGLDPRAYLGRQRGEPTRASRRLRRCASRGRTPFQRADFRGVGADHLDAMRQLLPVADRADRHAMAALGALLRPGDVAVAYAGLDSERLVSGLTRIVNVTYCYGVRSGIPLRGTCFRWPLSRWCVRGAIG